MEILKVVVVGENNMSSNSKNVLDPLRKLLMTILTFETHHKAILKVQALIDFYGMELKFQRIIDTQNSFQSFCIQ